jgi:hypothetical protein
MKVFVDSTSFLGRVTPIAPIGQGTAPGLAGHKLSPMTTFLAASVQCTRAVATFSCKVCAPGA